MGQRGICKMTLRTSGLVLPSLLLLALPAVAQGTLEDYHRAERFLPGNLRHHAFPADVIAALGGEDQPLLVSPSHAEGRQISSWSMRNRIPSGPPSIRRAWLRRLLRPRNRITPPADLPFQDFDFVDNGKAIRFSLDGAQWTCQLANYECKVRGRDPGETQRSGFSQQTLCCVCFGTQPLSARPLDRSRFTVNP